jgi:type IV pilus assembly protein PilM
MSRGLIRPERRACYNTQHFYFACAGWRRGRDMALFNKKKSSEKSSGAPSPAVAADDAAPSDDFSDFSPEALAAELEGEGESDATSGKVKKGRGDKTAASQGRGVKPGTSLGLNIGNDSIKVVEAVAKGNAISITAMGMVPTPADSISNGVVMSANALVMAIRDALAQAGIKTKKVVTSVSGTGALVVRVIEVPKMSDGELLDNMKMDADRYIPFPPSEVEMDFKALRDLPSDPDSPNMEVLLAAAQREIIDLHVQVLQDAKLDPRAIDVEPLAVARALTHPLTDNGNGAATNGAALDAPPDYSDVFAVLNIGASGTEISILRGDLLVFTRTVPTGGNALTQALVDNLGLAWSDAEQLKREMGDALEPGDAAATPGGSTPDMGAAATVASDDDWSNFGEDATAPAVATAEATPAAETPVADPFEDDFFEQGPTQNEPGEQHQQKEEPQKENQTPAGSTPDADAPNADAPPANARPFFDFGDDTEPQEKMPTLEDGRPTSYADLLGEEDNEMDELPSLAPGVPKPGALPSAFDFPEEPPAAHAAARAAAEVFGEPASDAASEDENKRELPTLKSGAPASTEAVGDTRVDSEDAAVLPSETAAENSDATPFSFTFGAEEATAAPESATPAASESGAAENFDFGFESPAEEAAPAAPQAPAAADDPFAEFMASAGEAATAGEAAPEPAAGSTPAAPAPAVAPATGTATESADDFDLDSIFGENASGDVAGSTPAAGAVTMDAGDLDLGDISGDDFSADLSDFGAGLGGASVGEIDAKTLHGVLTPVLETLVNEVRRSLEYHTTRYPDAAVRRVVLVGGGAKLKNLDAYLTQQLGLPTTIGNPALQLGQSAPKLPPGYIEENGPLFAVALGLAMRELTK